MPCILAVTRARSSVQRLSDDSDEGDGASRIAELHDALGGQRSAVPNEPMSGPHSLNRSPQDPTWGRQLDLDLRSVGEIDVRRYPES